MDMAEEEVTRLGRVERRVDDHDKEIVRLETRTNEIERRVDALTPLMSSVVTLTVQFQNMTEELKTFMKRTDERDRERERERARERQELENRERERAQAVESDRLVSRRWLIGLVFGLIGVLISAGTLLAVSIH
jgi:chromosome segregation ATPase